MGLLDALFPSVAEDFPNPNAKLLPSLGMAIRGSMNQADRVGNRLAIFNRLNRRVKCLNTTGKTQALSRSTFL